MGPESISAKQMGIGIPVDTLSVNDVRRIAESDPAIRSGLLEFEIRPWYVATRPMPQPARAGRAMRSAHG